MCLAHNGDALYELLFVDNSNVSSNIICFHWSQEARLNNLFIACCKSKLGFN